VSSDKEPIGYPRHLPKSYELIGLDRSQLLFRLRSRLRLNLIDERVDLITRSGGVAGSQRS
jgi:hypothetical protein